MSIRARNAHLCSLIAQDASDSVAPAHCSSPQRLTASPPAKNRPPLVEVSTAFLCGKTLFMSWHACCQRFVVHTKEVNPCSSSEHGY